MTEYLPEDNRTYKEKGYWDARFDRCVVLASSESLGTG
jgi:hypothetical protein